MMYSYYLTFWVFQGALRLQFIRQFLLNTLVKLHFIESNSYHFSFYSWHKLYFAEFHTVNVSWSLMESVDTKIFKVLNGRYRHVWYLLFREFTYSIIVQAFDGSNVWFMSWTTKVSNKNQLKLFLNYFY